MLDEAGRDAMKVRQPAQHFSQPSPLPGNVRNLFNAKCFSNVPREKGLSEI